MIDTAERRKNDLTEEILRQIRARLGGGRADLAERFARRFYANVPPDDLLHTDPAQLYGAALGVWRWGQERAPGTARVRVYTPRLEEDGWRSSRTIVEIVNDDMPFLVDSVTAELNRQGLTVHLVIHPVFRVRRDEAGRLLDLPSSDHDEGALQESWMHVEVDANSDPAARTRARAALEAVLADVRAAVRDWGAMRAKLAQARAEAMKLGAVLAPDAVPVDEIAEAGDFLAWLEDDHFTFLGSRDYRFSEDEAGGEAILTLVEDSGLGVLSNPATTVFDGLRHFDTLPPDVRAFVRAHRLLMVTKGNAVSTVHRPVPLDAILVKRFALGGMVVGERLFAGLFTSAAYHSGARAIPFIRRKVDAVLARAGFAPQSHNGKALLNILETYPRDELFQIEVDELYATSLGILHLQERQRLALFVRRDPFERFVACLVFVPRERYDTALRQRVQRILEAGFQGACQTFHTQLADSALARLLFIIKTEPGRVPAVAVPELEAQLVQAARAWTDQLKDALIEAEGEEKGARRFNRYAEAFPTGYRETFAAEIAVLDIVHIEDTIAGGRLGINLYRPLEVEAGVLNLKIYNEGRPVALSDVLPMLEHMDLRVITEQPYEVRPKDRPTAIWIHDFTIRVRDDAPNGAPDPAAIKGPFQDALAQIWDGRMEDDGFNRLVLRAGLTAAQVSVLRAYAKALRQAHLPFTQDTVEATLAAHPAIAANLSALFEARFDPNAPRDCAPIQAEIAQALDEVANLDEDRILRRVLNLIEATLRTNAFQRAADGAAKPYLAFKFDSPRIVDLPLPRPLVEVFVYSPRMEGVHLRGGKVARGGIRWSDRREDFRTEILGLMKAQMVKNAVIVPVGSKGGFVVKRPPPALAGREAALAEGIECYRILIRGLLDLTDSYAADGAVVAPAGVVRLDGDDPYLVVAADKGTASFSDIANGLAIDYGFWLGDAFASGGSHGYDHKGMAITARGAWESVKRHFRELGRDIAAHDFTVVGVGDMSGDVFGNAMLLSRHIKLLGAFDHRHIFCDPAPDPERSWGERRRLFDLPRSAWADYTPELLSTGGRVFERAAKSLTLTPEIQAAFAIPTPHVTPGELMRAMLRAEVDLLWFGGIGTYLKSAAETNTEVGDKANDALRLDAGEIRAKIIGEGANLALTQKGRIQAARAGVKLNTDAIDNSAGVDTSDHEVNIKILLDEVVANGDLTLKGRDQLLVKMTDEVADLVLTDNYLQTQALSVAEARAVETLEAHARFIRSCERAGRLHRQVEALPDDEDLAGRQAERQGLTRPELAVLMAYAKITLYDDLLASDLPDDPFMVEDLARYFPSLLRRDFADAIARHRLRREIIATRVTNSLVNRVGPVFVMEMMEKTGHGPADIARAYAIVREAFGLRALWGAIEALDTVVPAARQCAMMIATIALMERAVAWFLLSRPHPLDIRAEIETFGPGIATLATSLKTVLDEEEASRLTARAAEARSAGAGPELAERLAGLPVLAAAPDLVRIAEAADCDLARVAAIHFRLGRRFGLEWLRDRAAAIKTDNHWHSQAVAAIIDDLFAHQSRLTSRILDAAGKEAGAHHPVPLADPLELWIAERRTSVARLDSLLAELRAQPRLDLAMLAVANRQLRGLIGG